jgi:uncharacterized protein (TIGR04255 family)
MPTGDQSASGRTLSVPAVPQAHYSKNLIATAVCELRFPVMFELDDGRPSPDFARALRKDYPNYAFRKDIALGEGGMAHVPGHAFSSKNKKWTIVLRNSALTLETSNYESYEDFESRLAVLIEASQKAIDSDFYTRVGLRYINLLPVNAPDVSGWVNPNLAGPLATGVYGDVLELWQRVRGRTDIGGYNFSHGVQQAAEGPSKYVLDIDFFRDDAVDLKETRSLVRKLHDQAFSLFVWTLGPKALSHLGPSTK